MKVVCIIHSLKIGGMERVMAVLLNNFSKYPNVELHLLLIGRTREVVQEIPDTVYLYKPKWEFNEKQRFYNTLKTLQFIRSTLVKITPDTILSFGEMWNTLVLIANIGLPFPVFVADRSKPNKNLGKLQNFLRDALYPRAKGFIAQTEKSKEVAERKNWNKNSKIIGNPVNFQSVVDFDKKKAVVLTVGRLIPTKNVNRLIVMFAEIQKESHWKMFIVGGNAKKLNLLEIYQNQVTEAKLQDTVFLLGEKSDVKPYYTEASIFAFSSTSEGFPNALAEGMAAGCACIAYDCIAGPSDIIDDGVNGFLIPEGNENLFKEKLLLLMNDTNLRARFAAAAQKKIKQFEAKEISKRFFNFITE
jgi:GalNAc-alpha-(1->4)-GalNAc-alpha-(1->3)-diNAcBac-PP-undecaprenol alpha-1,4-N-acetyl-D-galactosaminyltransferase